MSVALPRWFLRLPLARKLTVLATATSAVSVLISCAVLAWYDGTIVRSALVADTETLVDSLAASSTATLSFDDARGAAEVLKVASLNHSIARAALLKRDGIVFAQFDREPATEKVHILADPRSVATGAWTSYFTEHVLVVIRPVRLDGDLLGSAYVELNLADMDARLGTFRRALGGALLSTVCLAMFIGWRLQMVVSKPLLHLTDVTRTVARDRDYSLRAVQMFDDEVGELSRSFNNMLAHIQERDAQLESHRQELEQTVSLRTAELQSSVERFKLLVERTNEVPWEIANAFDRSLEGLKRVEVIVRSMKEFTHPGKKAA